MTAFRIAIAAALSIILAGPAIAYDDRGAQGPYTPAFRGHHDMRVRTMRCISVARIFIQRFQWGRLCYGDGNYPGSIDDNMGPPYWGRW